MYRKDNVSARTQSMESKEECFERNIYCLNIIFYLGKGFILRRQLIALLRLLYGINQHKANDMIGDLLSHGLLIKKQATDTKTCVYVLTKFPLSKYHNCSSRDTCSIKLNNRKIWSNIYRCEFIITKVIPNMEKLDLLISLDNLFSYLYAYNISIFTCENQASIYSLYEQLNKIFPIKDKEAIENGKPKASYFYNDMWKCKAELFNHHTYFLNYDYSQSNYEAFKDVEICQKMKKQIEDEKEMFHSPKDQKINFFNLFNMVSNGFFFMGLPDDDGNIEIGIFDKCNNMYLKKIYDNIICIFYMMERYLGYYPHIKLNVYLSDNERLYSLENKECENGFDYDRQESSGLSKRNTFFKNFNVPKQYWDYIQVDYIYYPLREKYNL